ncbi:MAG TPA: exodeoxyribonuclease VII small subunit [Candidatus Eisenbacteria bacterium]|nr:exodeoxyribonuclease VII small subunit [Candidatus Eisenbacteria bacterium]
MRRKETPAPSAVAGDQGQTFETMMERLEGLVERLEEGNLSLEESIKSFEEGVDLVKRCTTVLGEAERRIQKLTRDAEGNPATAPLERNDEVDEGRDGELPF